MPSKIPGVGPRLGLSPRGRAATAPCSRAGGARRGPGSGGVERGPAMAEWGSARRRGGGSALCATGSARIWGLRAKDPGSGRYEVANHRPRAVKQGAGRGFPRTVIYCAAGLRQPQSDSHRACWCWYPGLQGCLPPRVLWVAVQNVDG